MSERSERSSPRVVIAGWHGRDVEHDHRVLGLLVTGLRGRRPDLEIVAAGPDPMAITTRHGIAGVPIGDPVVVDAVVADAAALLVGGGPPWRDTELIAMGGVAALFAFDSPGGSRRRWQVDLPAVLQILLLALIRGVPIHLHGIDHAGLEDDGAVALVGLLTRAAVSLTTAPDDLQGALDAVASLVPVEGPPPALPPGRLRRRREP